MGNPWQSCEPWAVASRSILVSSLCIPTTMHKKLVDLSQESDFDIYFYQYNTIKKIHLIKMKGKKEQNDHQAIHQPFTNVFPALGGMEAGHEPRLPRAGVRTSRRSATRSLYSILAVWDQGLLEGHTYRYAYIHVYIYIYIHVYVYVYIHIHRNIAEQWPMLNSTFTNYRIF